MIRLLQRALYRNTTAPIRWRQYLGNIEFLVYNPQTEGSIIYMIDDKVTFPELQQRQLFKQTTFKLPKNIEESTPIVEILTEVPQPVSIEVQSQDTVFTIKNRLAEIDQQLLVKNLNSNSGIYWYCKQDLTMNQNKKLLHGFYLRLQAEGYLKTKGINVKDKINPDVMEEILSYLGSSNQVPEQSQIFKLNALKEKIALRMNYTQYLIDQTLAEADKLLKIYRMGVIGLTALHLGGFGYAIFGVQWLGWDIIEPLTFSVGTIYTLLGLRFYRKFKKDRKQQTIQECLRDWVLNSQKRIQLESLRSKLEQEQSELNDVEERLKLSQHRLVNLSTLPNDL